MAAVRFVRLLYTYFFVIRFTTGNACEQGTYWDAVTHSCASCSDICLYANIQRTEDQCRKLCPTWTDPRDRTSPSVTPPVTAEKEKSDGISNHILAVLIISLVLLAVVVVVVVILLVYWRRCCFKKQGSQCAASGSAIKHQCRECLRKNSDDGDPEALLPINRSCAGNTKVSHPEQDKSDDPVLPSGGKNARKALDRGQIPDNDSTYKKETE